jgi:hypothetical protein
VLVGPWRRAEGAWEEAEAADVKVTEAKRVDGGQKVSHFGGQEVGYLALPGEGNLQPDS